MIVGAGVVGAFGVNRGFDVIDYPAITVGVVVFDLVGGSGYAKQEAFREGIGVAGPALAARPVAVAREPDGELADS
jgi:hypothetical protein